MQLKSTLVCLALVCCFAASVFAQNETKAEKAKQRAIATQTKNLMKFFVPAELTDEQKTNAKEVIAKHIDDFMAARKTQEGLLTKEQKKARAEALKKLKEEGVKGPDLWSKSLESAGLSEDEAKAFNEAKQKTQNISNKMKQAIMGKLTDDQKAAMPKPKRGKKGKKGKKGAGGKKGATKESQQVSVKLPGMT
ncbi:MAG: hypothetical protein AAF939_18700 [Planctomycetota bacterium]